MNPIEFDPTVDKLHQMIAATAQITASDLSDDTQIALVHEYRIKLRDARTAIEKKGKDLRADALKFQKDVIAKEKELLGIIGPEEDRLKAIETEAREIKERAARVELLPMRREQLAAIDITDINDEALLDLDNEQFIEFLNSCKADYLDKQIAAANAEKERLAQEARLAQVAEEARVAERKRIEDQARAEEESRIHAEATRQREAEAAAQKLIDDAKLEADRLVAEAKEKEEARKQAEKDEAERRTKDDRHQRWLSDIGYKEEESMLWYFKQDGDITSAFKFISSLGK